MSNQVRLRFAPSPTGRLHVGLAHTALFNWLFARHCGGEFILRIEDTDVARQAECSVDAIFEDLRWLGIDWDEGPDVGGQFGPYVQSQRLSVYRDHAQRLLDEGHAYHCYCSSDRLTQIRREQQERGETPQYDRHCRELTEAQAAAYRDQGIVPVVRLKIPLEGETTFHDLIRGDITFNNSVLDDIVLLKSDGYPTYHLANIVDDHLMKISHVMRAEEWISSTPKHIVLYRAFGWEPPLFAHLPLILGPDKSKLSKRHGATAVSEYRERGYLPQAMLNFLALMGWSPGDDREKMELDEIIKVFSIEGITKSGAIFDEVKLEWLNGRYLRDSSSDELLDQVAGVLLAEGLIDRRLVKERRDWLIRIIDLLKERARRVVDFVKLGRYFFEDPEEYEGKGRKKHWRESEVPSRLKLLAGRLEELKGFGREEIEDAVRSLAYELGISAGKLIHPTRLAVSGMSSGPGLFDLMELVGQEAVVRRLNLAVEFLNRQSQAA